MADPSPETTGTLIGGAIAAIGAIFVIAKSWWNRDKVDSSSSSTQQAYNRAAEGIVKRLEVELAEVSVRLDRAERERDECNQKYQVLQTTLLELAHQMLTVRGMEEIGHAVIGRLNAEKWEGKP